MPLGKIEKRELLPTQRFGRTQVALWVFVTLTVVSILLFPSTQGPYSAVNGPATEFRAARLAAIAHTTIAQAVTHCESSAVTLPLRPISEQTVSKTESPAQFREKYAAILRC